MDVLQELRKPTLRFLDDAPIAAVVSDSRGTIVYVNRAACDLLGHTSDELLGVDSLATTPLVERAAASERFARWRAGHAALYRTRLCGRNGDQSIGAIGMPILVRGQRGEFLGVIAFFISVASLRDLLTGYLGRVKSLVSTVLTEIVQEARDAQAAIRDATAPKVLSKSSWNLRTLSEREWEIVDRVFRGQRVPLIASDLGIAVSTVRNHMKSIYRKIGVTSQADLVRRLLELSG